MTLNRDEVIADAVARSKPNSRSSRYVSRSPRPGKAPAWRHNDGGEVHSVGRPSWCLPTADIVSELQEATSLTRQTLVDVLTRSGRLNEFIGNPNDFIAMVKRNLLNVVAASVQEGVQYEKVGGYVYELRELQADGAETRDLFMDRVYDEVVRRTATQTARLTSTTSRSTQTVHRP